MHSIACDLIDCAYCSNDKDDTKQVNSNVIDVMPHILISSLDAEILEHEPCQVIYVDFVNKRKIA